MKNKQLELNNLPSPVLLVWGLPEENIKAISLYELMMSMLSKNNFPSGEWKLIGNLSELTVEQTIELVKRWDNEKFENYKYHLSCVDTALESFHSAIESEGIETKTLPANTLIFKKL